MKRSDSSRILLFEAEIKYDNLENERRETELIAKEKLTNFGLKG
jgi:hypothetical protein